MSKRTRQYLGLLTAVAAGGFTYMTLCAVFWKATGNRRILAVIRKSSKAAK